MIDLYAAPTANCHRVSVTLEELGFAYRVHAIDRAAGEQRLPEFLRINPAGAVPVLVDPDGPGGRPMTLAQSGAIVLYLAGKSGRLIPTDPERRRIAMQWFLQALTDVNAAASVYFLVSNVVPGVTPPVVDYFQARLLGFLRDCDRQLAGRDFLAGELSIADLALYPVVAFRRALVQDDPGFDSLRRWDSRMRARPAVERGMAVPSGTGSASR